LSEFCLWINRLIDSYVKRDCQTVGLIDSSRKFIIAWSDFNTRLHKVMRQSKSNVVASELEIFEAFYTYTSTFRSG